MTLKELQKLAKTNKLTISRRKLIKVKKELMKFPNPHDFKVQYVTEIHSKVVVLRGLPICIV